MDGPNVNWALFKLLSEDLQKASEKKFVDIGSCGLHTMHNAFRAGLASTGWELGHFFSSLSWLFKDTPARREDFTSLTGSSDFPLEHCQHRWVENVEVAERALKVWPHVKKFIQSLITAKKAINTKSFEHLKGCMDDVLLIAKIESFISIAKVLQPFLKRYQTDAPLLPFMAQDLFNMLRSLLQRFVTPAVFKECTSVTALLSADLSDIKNLLPPGEVDIGFKAKSAVKEIKSKASARDIFNFQMESRKFLVTTAIKLMTKSPLKNQLVQCLKWLQPKNIVEDFDGSLRDLDATLSYLVELGRVSADDCDDIKSEFTQWHSSIVTTNSIVFQSFSIQCDRLDTFFNQHINSEFSKLWALIRGILILSHGQAQVERGFSTNKETMCVNMMERTLIAKRMICNSIEAMGGIKNVTISSGMRMAAASARSKYRIYLEERAEEEKRKNLKRKRNDQFEELEAMKAKKARFERDITSLTDSADKLAEKAENTNSHKFLIESNALRRSAKLKKEQIEKLTLEIETKVREISGL